MRRISQLGSYIRIFVGFYLAVTCPVVAADEEGAERVVLQLKWSHQFQFAGYYMAKHLGYYKNEGIDVEFRPGSPTLDVTEEVLSGRADFGVGTSSLLLDYAAGKPVVVLGVIYQHSPLVLIMHSEKPSDTIERVAEGPLMIEARSGDLLAMLRRAGFSIDQLDIRNQPQNALELLGNGKGSRSISAYLTDEPHTLRRKGIQFATFTPRTYGIDFYGDNFFTTRQMTVDRKSLVQRFRKATILGWQEALRNPEKAVDLILKEYPTEHDREKLLYEARITQDLMTNLVTPGYMSTERWQHIADTFLETEMLEKTPDLTGFVFMYEKRSLPKWFWPTLTGSFMLVLLLTLVSINFRNLNVRLRQEVNLRIEAEKDLKSSNLELMAAKKISEDANLKKTWFITNVSHDLKAPVSAMISLTQIFNHHSKTLELPEKFNRFLRQLHSGGEFLILMLDNILDHSAFEINAVSVCPVEVNLEKLFTDLINMIQPLADEKHVSIRVQWHSKREKLLVDPTRLSQIFLNLLHNAIKFSPKGGVVFLDLTINPHHLVAEVRDQGPGIPIEKLNDLFTMFGKSDRTGSRHSSTGLGLSIVKRNVELLNGTIRIGQGVPNGAVFTITIPLGEEPAPQ